MPAGKVCVEKRQSQYTEGSTTEHRVQCLERYDSDMCRTTTPGSNILNGNRVGTFKSNQFKQTAIES